MSDDKAPSPPTNTTTQPNNTNNNASNSSSNKNDSSLPSRIHSSASSLAKNAFFTPSAPTDIANTFSNAAGSTKAPAPASVPGSSSGSTAQSYYTDTSNAPSSVRDVSGDNNTTGVDSFRSSASAADYAEESTAFQHAYDYGGDHFLEAGTGPFTAVEEDTGIGKGKGKGKQPDSTFDHVWQTTTTNVAPAPPDAIPQTRNQDHADGADVLTLLSSPSFNPDHPDPSQSDTTLLPTDLSNEHSHPPPNTTLTPTEIQILDTFRRHDPSPTTPPGLPHQSAQGGVGRGGERGVGGEHKITPTSLIPDIDTFLDTIPAQQQNDTAALRDAVLTGLPGAGDWVGVEERYQDEVWGFLKPALEEAAREMEESKHQEEQGQTGPREDGPAVARLKMILRHMGA